MLSVELKGFHQGFHHRCSTEATSLYFDFDGASARQLLPSLLPLLYAKLQRSEATFRSKMLRREQLGVGGVMDSAATTLF